MNFSAKICLMRKTVDISREKFCRKLLSGNFSQALFTIFFDYFKFTTFFLGHAALTLRSRLRCIVMKKSNESSENGSNKKVANLTTKSGPMKFHLGGATPTTNLLVLNEVVIDRGPSPYLSNIGKDLYFATKNSRWLAAPLIYCNNTTLICFWSHFRPNPVPFLVNFRSFWSILAYFGPY